MGKNTDFKFHELDRAIVEGDLEAVKTLLTAEVSLKIKNRALLMAAKLEKVSLLEWLIPLSDPKFNDSEPLYVAARNKCEQTVALLIPVSNPRIRESRALKTAAAYGSLPIIKMLIPVSDVKNSNDYLGSPLMIAARCGHADCVAYLLPRSRPNDQQGKTGETALMMAAAEGHKECVELLLPLSTPDVKDHLGFSAAGHAMENGHDMLAQHIKGFWEAMVEAKEIGQGIPASLAAAKPLSL